MPVLNRYTWWDQNTIKYHVDSAVNKYICCNYYPEHTCYLSHLGVTCRVWLIHPVGIITLIVSIGGRIHFNQHISAVLIFNLKPLNFSVSRQQRTRQSNKTPCCIISLTSASPLTTSLPLSATLLIVLAAVVCMSFVSQLAATWAWAHQSTRNRYKSASSRWLEFSAQRTLMFLNGRRKTWTSLECVLSDRNCTVDD